METEEDLTREREFSFGERDFYRVCEMIYARAGISLSESKRDLVYGRLARRLRSVGVSSFAEYLDLLEASTSPEWEHFINALTTNLTSFFRERHHFDMLATHLRSHAGQGCLRIWSAAASTGEEAYTMAITVAQTLHRASDVVKILATDIDTNVIATGRAGVYPVERIDSLPADLSKKYFERGTGHHEGKVRVVESLRRLITFRRLNLLAPQWPMKHPFDVVFCRNVLIYFDKPTQQQLMSQMADYIKPGGLLCIGHSENPPIDRKVYEPLGRTAYRVLGGGAHG
jgi:chemotaxis protein methyltransferase CheR